LKNVDLHALHAGDIIVHAGGPPSPDIPIGANALRNSIVIDPPKRDT
jgi:hypothetical protein